jgi:hypothetical protein
MSSRKLKSFEDNEKAETYSSPGLWRRFQLCLTRRPGTSPGLLSSLLPVLLGTPRELLGGLVRRPGALLARLAQRLRGLLTGLTHGLHCLLTRLRSSAVAIIERP